MLPALKLGLAAGGLGIIALEGWGASTLYGKKEKPGEPIPRTLEQSGVNVSSSGNKLQEKSTNKQHLVTDSVENFYWWNWVFEYRYLVNNEPLDDHFKSIEKGYDTVVVSGTNAKQFSLNKACAKAYEMQVSHFNSKENLKKNIKSFCTHKGTQNLTFS